jgi:hypothetical protein
MARKEEAEARKEVTAQLEDEGFIVYQNSLERELDDAFTALFGTED